MPLELLLNNTYWDGKSSSGSGRADFTRVSHKGMDEYLSEVSNEGDTELWEVVNLTGDAHPIHTHLTQVQLMNRQEFDLDSYQRVYEAAFRWRLGRRLAPARFEASVRDQAQAVIPGAKVTLTNTGTNVARDSLTNESGLYVFPAVTPGPYRITVEFAGMQKFEGNLQVQTAQDASVDVALQVATGVTTVDVKDVTPMVQTDNPSLGHVLERQRIEQLPGLGRGYQNLLQTVPGVTWSAHGHGIGGRMQAYGLPTGSNMIVLDGAPINETYEGWDMPRTPDLDTLQELHVEVNNSSAKYSRPSAVIMSTRSGTNQFHGSLFENQPQQRYTVWPGSGRTRFTKPPSLNRNEYGVTAGGPVYHSEGV